MSPSGPPQQFRLRRSLSPSLFIFGPGQVGAAIHYPALDVSLHVLLWALCLGIVSTGFAYFGISLVLKRIRPNTTRTLQMISISDIIILETSTKYRRYEEMNYKGYIGDMEVAEREGVIYGRVINMTRDKITFSGKTVEEARRDFEEAVDDYLSWAEEEGFEPEKPHRGEFMVRTTPELHKTVSLASRSLNVSISQFTADALRSYVFHLVEQGSLPDEIYREELAKESAIHKDTAKRQ